MSLVVNVSTADLNETYKEILNRITEGKAKPEELDLRRAG